MNIRGKEEVSDLHYRYRMPVLLTAQEGKRNGAKTVLVNLPDIAKSLGRPAEEIMQFFAKDLGAQGKSKASEGKYVLRGEHTTSSLQNRLFIYIENFVLCPTCGNPETQYKVHLKGKVGSNSRKALVGKIFLQCAACGSTSNVGIEHGLCKNIVKDFAKSQEVSGNSSRKKSQKTGSKGISTTESNRKPVNSEEGQVNEGQVNKSISNEKHYFDNQASSSMEDESGGNSEQSISHAVMQLKSFMQVGVDARSLLKEALRLETVGCFPKGKHVEIIVRALFDSDIRDQISSKSNICRELCKDIPTSLQFICSLEILTLEHPLLVSRFPLILKDMYEEDILEEESILSWGKRTATRCQHSSPELTDAHLNNLLRVSAPLVRWLENADMESDETSDCSE